MSLRLSFFSGLIALFSALNAGAAPPALPDQFGATHGLDDYTGEPLLVIVAAGRKLRWIGKWEQALRAELPDLVSLRVAAITDKKPPPEEKVAAMLQQRAPPDVSILIDLQNTWAATYDLDPTEPCLLVLDPDHNIVAQFRGRPNELLVAEVIDALRTYFPARVSR